MQYSICHERQSEVDPFWETLPVEYREYFLLLNVALEYT